VTTGQARLLLDGVPETSLWTLHHRALEARRVDRVLDDPRAIELVDAIDYPFEPRFGHIPGSSQAQALRVKCFDLAVQRFLAEHPAGNVVALGEGFETQFWRVDNGRVRWLTVDLPVIAALRHRFLPQTDRQHVFAGSATDPAWLDAVDPAQPTLVTAQGLFMYLPPVDVHRIMAECARRLPNGAMVFDAIPRWFSALTQRGLKTPQGYVPPAMPWAVDAEERRRIRALHSNIASLEELQLPSGRGFVFATLSPLVHAIAALRHTFPVQVMRLQFGPEGKG
jgi:O-methyltransferase involved in polyketide biosynthesis